MANKKEREEARSCFLHMILTKTREKRKNVKYGFFQKRNHENNPTQKKLISFIARKKTCFECKVNEKIPYSGSTYCPGYYFSSISLNFTMNGLRYGRPSPLTAHRCYFILVPFHLSLFFHLFKNSYEISAVPRILLHNFLHQSTESQQNRINYKLVALLLV